jgi:hypothetical protein
MDWMMAVLLRHSPLGDIILGGVHRREGPMVDFLEEQCLYLAHRQHRVSMAMELGRAVAPYEAMAASMAGLVRGFASVFHFGDGLEERGGVTSRVCA